MTNKCRLVVLVLCNLCLLVACQYSGAIQHRQFKQHDRLIKFLKSLDGQVTHDHVKIDVPIDMLLYEDTLAVDQDKLASMIDNLSNNPRSELTIIFTPKWNPEQVAQIKTQLSAVLSSFNGQQVSMAIPTGGPLS